MSHNQTIDMCKNFFFQFTWIKQVPIKKKDSCPSKREIKEKRERKKARRYCHKDDDKEECASTVSDESLGTFCDRYETKNRDRYMYICYIYFRRMQMFTYLVHCCFRRGITVKY